MVLQLAQGAVSYALAPSSNVWVPRLSPAVLSLAGGCQGLSGVWSLTQGLRSPFLLETTNNDTCMEPPGCGGTPGEGGKWMQRGVKIKDKYESVFKQCFDL